MSKEIVKKIWPEWELDDKPLGSGSYGTVYRAVRRDNGVESTAAIKVISVPLNTSEIDSLRSEGLDENATRTHLKNVVDDYVREIKLMESMKGMQNIVSIEDYKVIEKEDEIGWYILIRMELLTPLNTYLCDKTFSETEAIKLGIDICSALEICAKSNIIHRDIKPENIFVNAYGYFKLGDFGIAKQFESMTGSLSQNRGTYYYMAPEVAKGTDYDVRADIYSLGIVLYRLLNKNHLPFLETEKQLTNPLEREKAVNRRISGEPLPPPSEASPATADLILWACEPDPANRISSAAEFKKLLINAGNGNYVPRTKDFNATVSVRRAPDALNGTVAVRRAEAAPKTDEVGTFGQKPKKKGIGLIIAVIALLAALIAVGAFFGISALKGNDSKSGTIGNPVTDSDVQSEEDATDDVNTPGAQSEKESENNAVYSDADEEKIQAILTDAEQLAASEDYENACAKISAGLVTYPKSEELKAKSEEYGELLAKQVKEKTLAEADALADAGSYEEAIAVIEEAQKDNKNDTDYKEAVEKYTSANQSKLVDEALASADALAQSEDYLTALSTLKESETSLGKDERFDSKISEYEKLYVNQVLNQADQMIVDSDFDGAKTLLTDAKDNVSDNAEIITKIGNLDYYRPSGIESYHIIDFNGIEKIDGIFVDSIGNSFDGRYQIYNVGWDEKYAIINLKKECLRFSGSIVTLPDSRPDEEMVIMIYADDKLIYTSDTISKLTGQVDFSVDVTNCYKLTIKAGLKKGDGRYASCSLVNTQLTKNPSMVSNNLAKNDTVLISAATGMEKLPIIDSNGFESSEEYFIDSYGYGYNGYSRFYNIGWDDKYVIYNIADGYSVFSGSIVCATDTRPDEQMKLMFYVDDELKYTTPAFGKLSEKIDFNIDVSQGKKLTIKGGLVSGDGRYAYCVLVNLNIKK